MNTQVAEQVVPVLTEEAIVFSEEFLREMDERAQREREAEQRMNCLLEAFRL
jgi:hypothetical protein